MIDAAHLCDAVLPGEPVAPVGALAPVPDSLHPGLRRQALLGGATHPRARGSRGARPARRGAGHRAQPFGRRGPGSALRQRAEPEPALPHAGDRRQLRRPRLASSHATDLPRSRTAHRYRRGRDLHACPPPHPLLPAPSRAHPARRARQVRAARRQCSARSTASSTSPCGIASSKCCSSVLASTVMRGLGSSFTCAPRPTWSSGTTMTDTSHSYTPAAGMRSAISPCSSKWVAHAAVRAGRGFDLALGAQAQTLSSLSNWRARSSLLVRLLWR